MPVPLPVQPANINLPAAPADPPTLDDIITAKVYADTVNVAHGTYRDDAPTREDAAQADIYKTNVIIAMAAAPAWFLPALRIGLAPLHKIAAKGHNMQCNDGTFREFEIVPFGDGSLPTENPHNLPPLHNVAAIRALSAANTTLYVAGYGLGQIPHAADRRKAIGRAIGCTVRIV